MRGACIRLSRMMPVPLRLPHNYTPVFFNTLLDWYTVYTDWGSKRIMYNTYLYLYYTYCCIIQP